MENFVLPGNALQSFALLNVKEVFVGVDSELAAGCFVAGDDGAIVHLQRGAGPFLADAAFDGGRKVRLAGHSFLNNKEHNILLAMMYETKDLTVARANEILRQEKLAPLTEGRDEEIAC